MNLESGKIKSEGNRVIGLKIDDMNKLAEAYSKKESSFTSNSEVTNEPMIQNQPLVEVIPEIMEGVTQEVPAITPVAQTDAPAIIQPIIPEVTDQTQIIKETPQVEPNIFDIPVAEPQTPLFEAPNPVIETPQIVEQQPYIIPQPVEEVQGGFTNTISPELDTPQKFFDKVEGPTNNTIIGEKSIANSNIPAYDDPAIIMLDNIKDILKSKNEMIEVLNNKINLLEEQVRKANEDRQISEAQRRAAEATLAQARNAEISNANGGHTLVYGQPNQPYANQNYNQAA